MPGSWGNAGNGGSLRIVAMATVTWPHLGLNLKVTYHCSRDGRCSSYVSSNTLKCPGWKVNRQCRIRNQTLKASLTEVFEIKTHNSFRQHYFKQTVYLLTRAVKGVFVCLFNDNTVLLKQKKKTALQKMWSNFAVLSAAGFLLTTLLVSGHYS